MTVTVGRASVADTAALASLRWTWRVDERAESAAGGLADYAEALSIWWDANPGHLAMLAEDTEVDVAPLGMAWLAIGDRVPSPSGQRRRSAWLQSVFVLPDRRGAGVGSALLAAVEQEARRASCAFVAVHPTERSVLLYERAGYLVSPGLRELRLDR